MINLSIKIKKVLRLILPRKLVNIFGFCYVFFHKKKHHKLTNNFYMDNTNNYYPWFTYPFIELLKTLRLNDLTVLEFGSGSSTLFWSLNCKEVFSIEKDKDWYIRLKKTIVSNNINNIHLFFSNLDDEYSKFAIKINKKIDILVIDGAARKSSLLNSLNYLDVNGVIIFDNIEWYPNSAKLLRDKNFYQFDFSGFSPLNSFETCTSIFVKNLLFFKNRRFGKRWHPLGGRYLEAYDD